MSFCVTAQDYYIKLNSMFSTMPSAEKKYYLKFGDSVKSKITDLENSRNIRLLTKVLLDNGYERIIDTLNEKYNYVIDFNFYISKPILPTPSPTTISTTNITNTNEVKIEQNSSSNNTNIKAVEFKPIDFSSFNYSGPIRQEGILYNRSMKLNCYNVKDQNQKIWFIELDSEGSSNDLRQIIPVLIFSTQGFYETDSKGVKEIRIRSNKKDLKRFLEEN